LNNEFVVAKLITGEMFMAHLIESNDEFIEVMDPVQIKIVHTYNESGESVERSAFTPFNHFSEDPNYAFRKIDLVYIQRLKKNFIPHYLQIVKTMSSEPEYNIETEPNLDSFFIIPEESSTH